VVKHKDIVLVLGNKDKGLTNKRVRLAELKVNGSDKYKVIFSGTKEEVSWMKDNSKLKAILEEKSTTTPQNLINSKKLIGNAKKVFIITDKSHAFRTRYLAKKILKGKTIEILGVKTPTLFMLKQLYYEFSRLIKHVFGLE
jgi:uncharacterized SAM-binding protein YcdF (DUF218 family)